jgi:hypothetical protein
MVGLTDLQQFVHGVESRIIGYSSSEPISEIEADYILASVDFTKKLLQGGVSLSEAPQPPQSQNPAPLSAAPTPKATPNSTVATAPEAALNEKPLVWSIDDETDITEVMQAALTSSGFAVRTFNNPKDAMQALDQGQHPDVILTDMSMPQAPV